MKTLIGSITACLAFTNATWAECLPTELTFMSCQIEQTAKTLSVCFDVTAVHYRFGTSGQPPDLQLRSSIATANYEPWNGTGRSISEHISFANKGYIYDTFAGFERMFGEEEYEDVPHRSFGGVRVFQNGALLVELQSDRKTVEFPWDEGLYDAKTALGYVWDHREGTWVERPD